LQQLDARSLRAPVPVIYPRHELRVHALLNEFSGAGFQGGNVEKKIGTTFALKKPVSFVVSPRFDDAIFSFLHLKYLVLLNNLVAGATYSAAPARE
jgi:hypothetical protein